MPRCQWILCFYRRQASAFQSHFLVISDSINCSFTFPIFDFRIGIGKFLPHRCSRCDRHLNMTWNYILSYKFIPLLIIKRLKEYSKTKKMRLELQL